MKGNGFALSMINDDENGYVRYENYHKGSGHSTAANANGKVVPTYCWPAHTQAIDFAASVKATRR